MPSRPRLCQRMAWARARGRRRQRDCAPGRSRRRRGASIGCILLGLDPELEADPGRGAIGRVGGREPGVGDRHPRPSGSNTDAATQIAIVPARRGRPQRGRAPRRRRRRTTRRRRRSESSAAGSKPAARRPRIPSAADGCARLREPRCRCTSQSWSKPSSAGRRCTGSPTAGASQLARLAGQLQSSPAPAPSKLVVRSPSSATQAASCPTARARSGVPRPRPRVRSRDRRNDRLERGSDERAHRRSCG